MNLITELLKNQIVGLKDYEWIVTPGPDSKFSIECPQQTFIVNPVFDMSDKEIIQILGLWAGSFKAITKLIGLVEQLENDNQELMLGMQAVISSFLRSNDQLEKVITEARQPEPIETPTVGEK